MSRFATRSTALTRQGGVALAFTTVAMVALLTVSALAAPMPDDRPASGDSGLPSNASAPGARLESVYPNPIADGDRGEFIHVRTGTCANLTLTDGETTAALPGDDYLPGVDNGTRDHHVVVTDAPRSPTLDIVRTQHPNVTVVRASVALANGGERLLLRCGSTVADRTTYTTAPEGEQWILARNGTTSPGRGTWRPPGRTPRQVHTYNATTATAFVLPDAPDVPLTALERADRRILLAGYTFSSERVARALVAAAARGVQIRVLVEGDPVGGLAARQAALLDRLTSHGIEVTVLGGPRARFAFHHAKYAVIDDTALVLTENWKPAGTGGRSSRGWGVRLDSASVAADLADLFAADASAHDAIAWTDFRQGRTFARQPAANGTYPQRFATESVPVEQVQVVTAPGNAEGTVVTLIDGADERVDVIQPTIGSRDGPFLGACLRAAKRGVEVRVLLSGAWYVVEENRRLVDGLNAYADRQGIPLSARIADPRSRYEKIHAKGLLVDGETVVVGSLNWNRHSARENREVAVALRSQAAATYFGRVFDADWQGGSQRVPTALVAAALAVVALAAVVGRRTISFENSVSEVEVSTAERNDRGSRTQGD